MIKLTKGPEPAVLVENGERWLTVLRDRQAAGVTPSQYELTRYRHADIKAALVTETHGKCAYCEGKFRHLTYGDVEHIAPKSRRLSDTFRWENLTLACDVCNTNKGDAENIIDPYVDEPSALLRFLGPFVSAILGDDRALISVRQLGLNREQLILDRAKRIKGIEDLLVLISKSDGDLRNVLLTDLIENDCADASEYAALVRSFLSGAAPEIYKAYQARAAE